MKTIAAVKRYSDARVERMAGKFLGEDAYDVLINEDCDVTKPDGSFLIRFRKNVLSLHQCFQASKSLREVALGGSHNNRGIAAGTDRNKEDDTGCDRRKRVKSEGGARYFPVKNDGTISNTHYAPPVNSGIVGYFNSNPRFPYCRLTAFNLNHPERFAAALPLIQSASDRFLELMPERWAAQRDYIQRTSVDFYVHGTVFTTITVNLNWQTAVHQDAGDLKEGFGVMTAFRSGIFDGCYLCFPQYRVAVDMRTRSLCLADVHEWHGNTSFKDTEGEYERLSLVMYYRKAMEKCGSAVEELEKAKAR